MTARLLVLLQIVLVTQLSGQQSPGPKRVEILRAEDTSLVLSDGRRWSPLLHDMRYHGRLPGPSNGFFVVSGFECTDCDAARQVYIIPLMATGVAQDTSYLRFYYPGTVGSETTPEGFIKSRVFVGACLASPDSLVVITESMLGPGQQWTDSTLVVHVVGGKPVVAAKPGRAASERIVLLRVREGRCREIPPLANQLEG